MGILKSFSMRSTLVITVLACLAMMSMQAINNVTAQHVSRRELKAFEARRISMTKQYYHYRRLGIKLPKAFCKPAHGAGTFIVEQAMSCAMQAIMPGSGMIGKVVSAGKAVAKKVGIMGKLKAMQHKAADFIIKKLLGVFGCKLRRLNFFKKLGKAVKKTVKKASKTVKKATKAVGKVAKNVSKEVGKGAKFVAKNAAKAAKAGAAFVKKYGGIIAAVACPVIRKLCKPGCMAAITAFKAAGAMIASTFHIPIGCLADALGVGCNKLCEVVCKKRRLEIRKF